MRKCPFCDIELKPLGAEGYLDCPKCRKIFNDKPEKDKDKFDKENQEDNKENSQIFNLNKQYEIVERGIQIQEGKFAVLLCHDANDESIKYIRLSWWKGSNISHKGMMKIHDSTVLNNLNKALEKIDESFDDYWDWLGQKYSPKEPKTSEQLEKEKNIKIIKARIIENKTCPNCQKTMKKEKNYYECTKCGEIVILDGYNQPIFNIDSNDLDLSFHGNLPINFYSCEVGITIKWFMAEWKAVAVIFSKDNPNKRWLRFYWWERDFVNYMKSGHHVMGEGIQMGWKAKRGLGQTNLYDKKYIRPLVDGLKKLAQELNWEIE